MKKSRFSEEQIVTAVRQAELGVPVEEVCRKAARPRACRSWQKDHSTPRRANYCWLRATKHGFP